LASKLTTNYFIHLVSDLILRFWLTRAIESFLRGGTSYADQMFLISRGIVEDTLQNILAINFNRPKEVLQSCFDMLGELIKFNTNGFDILNNQLNDLDKVCNTFILIF
jgi:Trpc4-associated protein